MAAANELLEFRLSSLSHGGGCGCKPNTAGQVLNALAKRLNCSAESGAWFGIWRRNISSQPVV
jgi:hypothetical protein